MADPAAGVIRLQIPLRHPTAVWFDGGPDLTWLAPWLDQEMGVTHVIRGEDLRPFTVLENPVAGRMGYQRRVLFHPVATDSEGVKWSKTMGAPRAVELGDPEQTLGRLAFALGMTPEPAPTTAAELLGIHPPCSDEPGGRRIYRTEEHPCGLPLLLP
jgi:glutamyl/glutaminyl-tRNA synthetase